MSRITRWSRHRGVKREHVRAEDTAHRNSHVINAACGSQQTRYLDTLLRSYTCPRSQFISTKSHSQHAIWTEGSGYSLECLLYKPQPVLKRATVLVLSLVSQWRKKLPQQRSVSNLQLNPISATLLYITCYQCKALDDHLNIGQFHYLRHFT